MNISEKDQPVVVLNLWWRVYSSNLDLDRLWFWYFLLEFMMYRFISVTYLGSITCVTLVLSLTFLLYLLERSTWAGLDSPWAVLGSAFDSTSLNLI